jgi:hypothetical protein
VYCTPSTPSGDDFPNYPQGGPEGVQTFIRVPELSDTNGKWFIIKTVLEKKDTADGATKKEFN